MELNDLMLVAIRWVHALAGAAWVGGGLFYLLVLQPSLADVDDHSTLKALKSKVAEEYKEVIELSVMALVVTGVILAFDRLSRGNVSNLYVAILAMKVTAAAGMFLLSWTLGQRGSATVKAERMPAGQGHPDPPTAVQRILSPSQLVLTLGALVFLLATLLQVIYEKGLRPL
ncbi:MAG: hypothetical protein M1358_02475 [Chloroflexi bacterium]|nr:hypothetical protein [Chloroflexota bacterium]